MTPDDMNQFMSAIALNQPEGPMTPLHEIEVPRRVIEHFNRGPQLAHFDEAGYFVYNRVKVFETGKKHTRDDLTVEQQLFGKKNAG